jgi:dTDP-4-amino-4,6-dideoxygalactose transaminase
MEWRVPLADLDFDEREEQAVLSILRSRWLTMGAVTQEFEREFADFVGVKHALAVSNATEALHLANLSLGIGPGDEVILPSLTFVASANSVLYTGASPRFVDICSQDELNISPEEIEKAINSRTKAILVVHYGGYPCRMPEILEIASQHGLAVIEDAAHAPGARLQGRSLGTWGDVGCFSFFSNKNLSTGEGGMVVTDRDDLAQKIRILRSHGMTSLTWDRHQGHAYSYDVVELGYNYRIDEIRSAIGRVQLEKLLENNARRKEITLTYWKTLEGKGYTLPFKDSPGEPSYHILPILLPDRMNRKDFIDYLRSEGIQTSIHYPPIHRFQYHRSHLSEVKLPVTEFVAEHEVTLPLYPTMEPGQVDRVVSAVLQAAQR